MQTVSPSPPALFMSVILIGSPQFPVLHQEPASFILRDNYPPSLPCRMRGGWSEREMRNHYKKPQHHTLTLIPFVLLFSSSWSEVSGAITC